MNDVSEGYAEIAGGTGFLAEIPVLLMEPCAKQACLVNQAATKNPSGLLLDTEKPDASIETAEIQIKALSKL